MEEPFSPTSIRVIIKGSNLMTTLGPSGLKHRDLQAALIMYLVKDPSILARTSFEGNFPRLVLDAPLER